MVNRLMGQINSETILFRPAVAQTDFPHYVDAHEKNCQQINLQEVIAESSDELADLLSTLGRSNRVFRKNNDENTDLLSSILEEETEEKLLMLIHQVQKIKDKNQLINFARRLFSDDVDLVLVFREMLLSRELSELKKKQIKEALADLEKFIDEKKVNSGINIGYVAKRFSCDNGKVILSAKALRNNYLRFLEQDLSATFIYQDWIEQYGYQHRKRLLAFTLSALIADMKASLSGINDEEFGPLSSKLSEARLLHTLDNTLIQRFEALSFQENLKNKWKEEKIVELYITGLIDFYHFKNTLDLFTIDYMKLLFIKQRATIMQTLKYIYNLTPDYLYSDKEIKEKIIDFMALLIGMLAEKERLTGIWSEYYN